MANLGTLTVGITANPSGFEKGVQKAAKDAKKLQQDVDKVGASGGGLSGMVNNFLGQLGIGPVSGFTQAVVAAATAMAVLTANSMQDISQQFRLAQQYGVTAEEIAQMQFAADSMGVSGDALTNGMTQLSRRVGEMRHSLAAGQFNETATALARLGINAEEFANANINEQLLRLADGMRSVQNPAERTALTMAVLGRQGMALLPLFERGTDELREMMNLGADMGAGVNMEDAALVDSAMRATRQISAMFRETVGNFGDAMAVGIAPAILAVRDAFISIMRTAQPVFGFLQNVLGTIAGVVGDVVAGIADVVNQVMPAVRMVFEALGGLFNGLKDGITSARNAVADFLGVSRDALNLRNLLVPASGMAFGTGGAALGGGGAAQFANWNQQNQAPSNLPAGWGSNPLLAVGAAMNAAMQQAQQAVQQQASLELTASIGQQTNALREQLATLGMTNEERQRYLLTMRGATAADLANFDALQRQIQARQELNALAGEMNEIVQRNRSPMDAFTDRMARLEELRGQGLGDDLFAAEAQRALEELERATGGSGGREVRLASAVGAGSAEQISAVNRFMIEGQGPQSAQERIQQALQQGNQLQAENNRLARELLVALGNPQTLQLAP